MCCAAGTAEGGCSSDPVWCRLCGNTSENNTAKTGTCGTGRGNKQSNHQKALWRAPKTTRLHHVLYQLDTETINLTDYKRISKHPTKFQCDKIMIMLKRFGKYVLFYNNGVKKTNNNNLATFVMLSKIMPISTLYITFTFGNWSSMTLINSQNY